MTIIALHPPSEGAYYDELKYYIQSNNIRPAIKCIQHNNVYYAIEGSHRLAICKELGIVPIIVPVVEPDVQQQDVDYNLFEFSNGLLKFLISEQQQQVNVVYEWEVQE